MTSTVSLSGDEPCHAATNGDPDGWSCHFARERVRERALPEASAHSARLKEWRIKTSASGTQ
eukprot:scaffold9142_cov65-Phaeocystis_antarctica.AAC.5